MDCASPLTTRQDSTYKSGKVVQTNGATSKKHMASSQTSIGHMILTSILDSIEQLLAEQLNSEHLKKERALLFMDLWKKSLLEINESDTRAKNQLEEKRKKICEDCRHVALYATLFIAGAIVLFLFFSSIFWASLSAIIGYLFYSKYKKFSSQIEQDLICDDSPFLTEKTLVERQDRRKFLLNEIENLLSELNGKTGV
jgi:hypothetical protein